MEPDTKDIVWTAVDLAEWKTFGFVVFSDDGLILGSPEIADGEPSDVEINIDGTTGLLRLA